MRKFSTEEKAIIKALVDSEILKSEGMILLDRFLEDNYMGAGRELSLFVDPVARKACVSFPESEMNAGRKKLVFVIKLLQLLRDLEANGLLAIVGNKNDRRRAVGNQFQDGITVELTEPFAEYIWSNAGCFLLPSTSLTTLASSNFRSEEYQRHAHTMVVAWIALVASIIFGVWGVWKDIILSILGAANT